MKYFQLPWPGLLNPRCKNYLFSVAILFFASCFCGLWFKYSQLAIAANELIPVYPIAYLIYPCLVLFLLFCIFWVFAGAAYKLFFLGHDLARVMFYDAVTYLFFALAAANIPIKTCFLLFLAAKALLIFFLLCKCQVKIKTRAYWVIAVLFFYGIIYTIFMGFLSPLSWWNPLAVYGHGESGVVAVGSLLYRIGYVNAKLFDFSGFDYSYWGTISHGITTLFSQPFAAITLLLDLPSIDVASFQRLLQVLYFFGCIASSFGFFLFILYGLRLSFFTALWGGLLLIFSNSFFITGFTLHFPAFAGGFLILPYVFLLLRLAFRKDNLNCAFFAGLIFALQYYIFPGHPDAAIHSFMMVLAYGIFHTLFNDEVKPLRRAYIFLCLGLGLIVGSALYLWPIGEAMALKEFSCWGHYAKGLVYPSAAGFFIMADPVLRIYGIFIAASFIFYKQIFKNRTHALDFTFFLIVFASFLILFLPGRHGFFNDLILRYSKALYFSDHYRIFTYFAFSSLVFALFGLQYLLENKNPRYLRVLILLFIIILMAVYYINGAQGAARSEMVVTSAIFLAVIAGFFKFFPGKDKKYVKFVVLVVTIYIFSISTDVARVRTNIFTENPHGNKPYITMQALLNNYKNLKEDPANAKYIKSRLLSFENDLAIAKGKDAANYYGVLKAQGFPGVAGAAYDKAVQIASCVYPFVDEYYLDSHKLYPPSFPIDGHDPRWIPDYNNVSILQNLGSRYQRILAATGTDSFMGVGEGFFIHNGTSTIDSRFMSGNRPLNALYLIPGEYYQRASEDYGSSRAWSFNTDILKGNGSRKIFNIAGMGVYLFNEKDFNGLAKADKEDLEVVGYLMPSQVKPPFVVVEDKRSYGMAYLAKRIAYAGPWAPQLDDFTPPFSAQSPLVFGAYKKEVDKCLYSLSRLSGKYDAIIERREEGFGPKSSGTEAALSGNRMEILNIIGNKAIFAVDCMHEPCALVLNYAAIHGWRAFCDRKPVRINKANFAFMSVDVPRGRHLIWFEHRRFSVIWGSIITLLGYLVCGAIFLIFAGYPRD